MFLRQFVLTLQYVLLYLSVRLSEATGKTAIDLARINNVSAQIIASLESGVVSLSEKTALEKMCGCHITFSLGRFGVSHTGEGVNV